MTASRELTVLGCSAQTPTADRAQNAHVLRWNRELVVLDPGEGTQRQMALAGIQPARVTRILLTHFHGDHCLGLPGLVQRRALSSPRGDAVLHYPHWGEAHVDRLLGASAVDIDLRLQRSPVVPPGSTDLDGVVLSWRRLDHTLPTVGWRIEEPPRPHLVPGRLAAAGVAGPDVGRLARDGEIRAGGRLVRLEEVSEVRPGRSFAFVMDTRDCDGARELAAGVDLLVCEATYLEAERHLAVERGHLTARGAAVLAAECGVGHLVVTHFSERYDDLDAFGREAAEVFDAVTVGRDLVSVPIRAAAAAATARPSGCSS